MDYNFTRPPFLLSVIFTHALLPRRCPAATVRCLAAAPAHGGARARGIVCKSRHFKTNFFICVQHPYQCPRALRSQCSHVILFQTKDKKLLEELAKKNLIRSQLARFAYNSTKISPTVAAL